MQTPNNLWVWLSEQAVPLAAIACFLAFVLIVLAVSARNRRIRMNRARAGASEETFVDALLGYGYDAEVTRTIYRYLREKQNVHFPIEPSDLLDEDLGLDIVDLDETILDVLELTRRQYRPGLRHTPLITVEDLVRFVQASPRSADRAA